MTKDRLLRDHLLFLLRGGGAHIHFEDFITGFPIKLINSQIEGVPYTPWQVVEHMRIAQWDILEFSRNPKHVSPQWPEGYWPKTEAPPRKTDWSKSVRACRADLKAMQDLVADRSSDLLARIPHGDGQTLLREALLVADHNSYHLGQIILLRRLLEIWKT